MKILITEEQLNLIIKEEDEGIKLPEPKSIPTFCGGSLNNDGCKNISNWGAPNGATYSNSYGDDRDEYIYPCGNLSIGDIIFVRKFNFGGRGESGAKTGMSKWRKKAEELYPKYLSGEPIKKKIFSGNKSFFNKTDIIKIDSSNQHLFLSGNECNHPYLSNALVSPEAKDSIETINNEIGNITVNSAYRDNIHQQMMIDFIGGRVAKIGSSNHQDGNALDIKGVGKTETDDPKTKWKSNNASTQSWLWMVYIGPYYNWCPYGTKDCVHFTYGSNYKSSDCNKDSKWGVAYNWVGGDPTGNDDYIENLCAKLNAPVKTKGNIEFEELKRALNSDEYPGLNKIREWCKIRKNIDRKGAGSIPLFISDVKIVNKGGKSLLKFKIGDENTQDEYETYVRFRVYDSNGNPIKTNSLESGVFVDTPEEKRAHDSLGALYRKIKKGNHSYNITNMIPKDIAEKYDAFYLYFDNKENEDIIEKFGPFMVVDKIYTGSPEEDTNPQAPFNYELKDLTDPSYKEIQDTTDPKKLGIIPPKELKLPNYKKGGN